MSSSRFCEWCSSKSDNQNTVYHDPDEAPKNSRASVGWLGVRHKQCCLAFFGAAAAFILKTNLSVAIVSMTRKSSSNADTQVMEWSESQKGAVLSAMFWTYWLVQIPGGLLVERIGPKAMLTISLFSGGVISILTPIAVIYGGFYAIIFMRVILGATQGVLHPSLNCFISKWAPTPERGRLFTCVFNGTETGIVVGMTLSGVLANSRWGWPSVFYVSGAMAIAWALLFWTQGADGPQTHKTISESERNYIINSLPNVSNDAKTLRTPWKSILKSHLVWTLIFMHCAALWGFMTLMTQTPSYLNAVFRLNIQKSGVLSSLPYIANVLMGLVFVTIDNVLSDKQVLSRIASKRLWNTVGSCGVAFSLFLLAFSGQSEIFSVVLLVAAGGFGNAIHLGFLSNHLDLAPNFAGTLMGITNTFANIASFLVPLFVGFVVSDPTSLFQWRIVFLTAGGAFFVGNFIYLIFCSVEVQPWNSPQSAKSEKK